MFDSFTLTSDHLIFVIIVDVIEKGHLQLFVTMFIRGTVV